MFKPFMPEKRQSPPVDISECLKLLWVNGQHLRKLHNKFNIKLLYNIKVKYFKKPGVNLNAVSVCLRA